jgi:predicted nucleic acid-binding protein
MPNPTRFGEVPLIADTTVWSKLWIAPQDVQEDFRAAAEGGLIVSSPVVRLEFLDHQANAQEFDEADARFAALPSLPITPGVCEVAIQALRDLRELGGAGRPQHHRVRAPDALVAATASVNEVNVLHDDTHYDRLATVLDFDPIRFGPYHFASERTWLQRVSRAMIRRLPRAYR